MFHYQYLHSALIVLRLDAEICTLFYSDGYVPICLIYPSTCSNGRNMVLMGYGHPIIMNGIPWNGISIQSLDEQKLYTIWLFNIAMENPWTKCKFLAGEHHLSMGHLYHGYVTNNQRVHLSVVVIIVIDLVFDCIMVIIVIVIDWVII